MASLNQQIAKVLDSPETRKKAEDSGTSVEIMTPQQLADSARA